MLNALVCLVLLGHLGLVVTEEQARQHAERAQAQRQATLNRIAAMVALPPQGEVVRAIEHLQARGVAQHDPRPALHSPVAPAARGSVFTLDFDGARRVTPCPGESTVDALSPEVAVFQLMTALEQAQNFRALRDIAAQHTTETPQWPTPWLLVGKAHAMLGRLEEATRAYRQFLRHTEGDPQYAQPRAMAQTWAFCQ
jgi:hypothetical protein